MPVFKLCLKIIQKNLPSMMIYVVIFLAIAAILSSTAAKDQQTDFSQVKADVAFISEESSTLIDGFKEELGKNVNYVNIPDETEKLQDALYFRSVTYIIRIPKGFTEDFMRGENVQIQKTVVPNAIINTYIDLNINQYFNTARLYVKNTKGITQEELVQHLKTDLDISTPVQLKTNGQKDINNKFSAFYFNYLAYTLSAVLIFGVSAIMLVFNDKDLSRRNFCSPITNASINFQFILANLLFTVVCWAIMIGFCFLLDIKNDLTANTLYHLLNSFVFTLCTLSISFLVGNLIKDRDSISAACNVVTLGPCFIGGVFVPQQFLNDTVLKIASFTPTYWYVKANNEIADLTNFSFPNLSSIFFYMLIQFGFTLAFFSIALVIRKKKRMSN